MSMPLHCTRSATEREFTDLFKDCEKFMRPEILELHSSEDNDDVYVFIVWSKDLDSADKLRDQLLKNAPCGAVEQLDLGLYSITEVVA
jgi:hypothetical protein